MPNASFQRIRKRRRCAYRLLAAELSLHGLPEKSSVGSFVSRLHISYSLAAAQPSMILQDKLQLYIRPTGELYVLWP
jgi:hypothetical protein